MLGRRSTITIKVRLLGGLDKEARMDSYDRFEGITLSVPEGTRLIKVVKSLGLPKPYTLVYFIDGERVGLRQKLEGECQIACLRPSAGG
jgi:hypothetical protein